LDKHIKMASVKSLSIISENDSYRVDITSTPDGVILGKTVYTDKFEGSKSIHNYIKTVFYAKRWNDWCIQIEFLDETLPSIIKLMCCDAIVAEHAKYHKLTHHNKDTTQCHISDCDDCEGDTCENHTYDNTILRWLSNTFDEFVEGAFDTYKFLDKCKIIKDMICPITHEPLDPLKAVITPCGHWFESTKVWSKLINKQCPMCRKEVEQYQLNYYPK